MKLKDIVKVGDKALTVDYTRNNNPKIKEVSVVKIGRRYIYVKDILQDGSFSNYTQEFEPSCVYAANSGCKEYFISKDMGLTKLLFVSYEAYERYNNYAEYSNELSDLIYRRKLSYEQLKAMMIIAKYGKEKQL